MTKLQFLCLAALEDMNLKELNKRYFEDGGIGYTKNVIAGKSSPHPIMMEAMCKQFEEKYQKLWEKELEWRNTPFKGW